MHMMESYAASQVYNEVFSPLAYIRRNANPATLEFISITHTICLSHEL